MYDLPVVAIVKMMVRGQRSLFVILLYIRATIFTRIRFYGSRMADIRLFSVIGGIADEYMA